MTETILQKGFDTRPIEMQPMWLLTFQAPDEDIDRIFNAVAAVALLFFFFTENDLISKI